MSARKHLKAYFTFTRKDRLGLLALSLLIFLIYALPRFFERPPGPLPQAQASLLARASDSLDARPKEEGSSFSPDDEAPSAFKKPLAKAEVFAFDPNTLSGEGWQRLGLSERTAGTIVKYRSKGGKFYRPEDLQKIWGLPKGFYERVKDSIRIRTGRPAAPDKPFDAFRKEVPERRIAPVNINTADSADWEALPGIGAKLAARIIAFRERLGGFHAAAQVGETFGLPDSTFQKVRPYLQEGGSVRTLNINTATRDEMRAHPYIRWAIANAIVSYREQHGAFKSIEDLKRIAAIDAAAFEKIRFYASTE